MTATVTAPGRQAGPGQPPRGPKMQTWYINGKGVEVRTARPVPVDDNNRRTAHLLYTCTAGGCSTIEWLTPGTSRHCPEHGKKMVTREAAGARDRSRQLAKQAGQLHGRAGTPWVVLLATVAGEVTVRVFDVPAGQSVPLTAAAAGLAYLVANRRLRRRATRAGTLVKGQPTDPTVTASIRRTARRSAAAAGAAAGWITVASTLPPTSWAGIAAHAALFAGWAMAAYPLWRSIDEHRSRPAPTPDLVTPTQTVDPVFSYAETRWKQLIGASQGALPGTHLEDFRRLPQCADQAGGRVAANWTARVVADVDGSYNFGEYRPNLVGRIAGAYACSTADVTFVADEGNVARAYVRVQPDNVLAQVRMWPGPRPADWQTGESTVGVFDDGQPIPYLWWTSIGPPHELMSGCTGSGKSELVVQLLLHSLHSHGLVTDWVGDPQGGQSYGALKDAVDWFARDKTEITLMLLAAKREMLRRNDVLAAANQKTWRPTRDMPLLVITLDEYQSVCDDTHVNTLVGDLAAMARKCGIKLRLITQVPAVYSLGESGGAIREQLRAGQTYVFRAATDNAARAAVDSDSLIDPASLPATWGPATINPGQTTAGLLYLQGVRGRQVFGRASFTGDTMDGWLVNADGTPSVSPGLFGPDAAAVSGTLWGDRKRRAERALMQGRRIEDLLPGGAAQALLELAEAMAAGRELPVMGGFGTPVMLSREPLAADIVFAAARTLGAGGAVISKDDLITETAQLATSTRDAAIAKLIKQGDLYRAGKGQYRLTADDGHVSQVA